MSVLPVEKSRQPRIFYRLMLLIGSLLIVAAMIIPSLERLSTPSLQVGQVAAQDYLAAESSSFTSQVMTEQKREAASRAVAPVYTRPDPSIARRQLEKLYTNLAFITSVRADTFGTLEQKLADLSALEDIHLDQEMETRILSLSEARWGAVQQETIAVLEQLMRDVIRPDRLEDSRNNALSLVSLSFPENQAEIVAELSAAFVTANSFYSEELTNAARQAAAEVVEPVNRTIISGERIVQRGQVLNSADLEALQTMGFLQPQRQWQEVVSAATLALVVIAFFAFFFRRQRQIALVDNPRSLEVVAGLFLIFLFAGRLALPGHIVIPYAFPLATYGLSIAILFGFKISVITALPLSILVVFGMSNDMELLAYYILGTLFGILAIGAARRLTSFFSAGTAIALTGVLVILAYRLPSATTDWVGITTLAGAALFNGLASASLTLVLQFFLTQFLGLTTPMHLTELTRPDHPLLQTIMREAPGTYQHSLQVANLAEQAAERIGADPLLTRVGALYHDAGKTQAAMYFIENQVPGFANPHESLDPQSSSTIIIRHVTDGVELLRRYRLPKRLWDFALEHHGTTLTRYQYVRAVEAAGGDESQVNQDDFRYPGPRPQTRETAILMLADTCEAAVRAERPADEDALQRIIRGTIESRMSSGQLDDTNLTLRDLAVIADSFQATLRGIYHPRVVYPKLENVKPPQLPATSDVPTLTRGQVEERAGAVTDHVANPS